MEHRAHLPLQRREAVLERPARRGQLLGALRHVPRAVLAHDPLPPPFLVLLPFYFLGDLLEHAVELARGALQSLHLREQPRRGRGAGARPFLFLAPPLLRDPVLQRGHGRRPLRLLGRRDGRVAGRGRPVLARHRADQRPHGEDEDGAHGVERESEPAPRPGGGGGGRRLRRRREVRRHGVHVSARGPVLGDAEGERAHGARGGRGRGASGGLGGVGGCVVGGEEPGDGPSRAGEVRGVERRREKEAGGCGERGAVRGPERGEREGRGVEDVERLDGAVEEVGGEAVSGRPGERGGDGGESEDAAEGGVGGDDGVEELGEEGEGEERGARGGAVRGERVETVGDVGLEGVEREELVVLRGVEGRDGGGAAAEAEHAEEARPGGRRQLGGGHGALPFWEEDEEEEEEEGGGVVVVGGKGKEEWRGGNGGEPRLLRGRHLYGPRR